MSKVLKSCLWHVSKSYFLKYCTYMFKKKKKRGRDKINPIFLLLASSFLRYISRICYLFGNWDNCLGLHTDNPRIFLATNFPAWFIILCFCCLNDWVPGLRTQDFFTSLIPQFCVIRGHISNTAHLVILNVLPFKQMSFANIVILRWFFPLNE